MYRGAAMQARSIRQQQYRTGSLPQSQQGALQARVHPAKTELLTDVPILTGSPSRQYMSHDFGQVRVQSKRLEPSMFSPTYGMRLPMARDAGQIKPSMTMPNKVEAPVNFYVPLEGGGFAMPRNAPLTPIASSYALRPKSTGGMGSVEFEFLSKNSAFLTCIATGTSAGLRHRH